MTVSGAPSAIFLPETSTTSRCEKLITARMMCSIMMMVMPRSLSRISRATMSATSLFESPAIEAHGARLVAQRAADAVDQRRLAGAVRANEAEPLAGLDRQVDAVERHEAAEAFADVVDLEQRSHGVLLPAAGSRSRSTRPQP